MKLAQESLLENQRLDAFELTGLLLACAAQIAVLVMTLQELPQSTAHVVPATSITMQETLR